MHAVIYIRKLYILYIYIHLDHYGKTPKSLKVYWDLRL